MLGDIYNSLQGISARGYVHYTPACRESVLGGYVHYTPVCRESVLGHVL